MKKINSNLCISTLITSKTKIQGFFYVKYKEVSVEAHAVFFSNILFEILISSMIRIMPI